jgi:arylsulfatase B
MVSSLDQNIGRILDVIERKGMGKNTIVIFHSDNGGVPNHGGDNHPLRGNKFTTWEGGVRVVGMIRWPLKLQGGTTFKSVAAYVDILPTLAAAAGLKVPSGVDGLNLLPYLEDAQLPPNRSLLLDEKTVVTDRWKLKDGSFFNLQKDPKEAHPIKQPPELIASRLRQDLSQFKQLIGPAHLTLLSMPKSWPPAEWALPHESLISK